jgi:hypothetical protein
MFYFGAKLVVFLADRVINARAGESRRSHPQQINQDDFFPRKKQLAQYTISVRVSQLSNQTGNKFIAM